MAEAKNLILVGAIMGAFGVRGEVRVKTFTDAPDGVAAYGPLFNEAGAVVLTPRRSRLIKDGIALSGPEIKDRDQAEALKGTRLYVPRAKLPPPSDDEFYHVDLIGLLAEDLSGAPLGQIVGVQNYGAGDLLEVKPAEGPNWLLPFTMENAPTLDFAARRIVLDPPAGFGPNPFSDEESPPPSEPRAPRGKRKRP